MDETLNDIVAEIRGEFVRIDLERLADRIEAAAKRDEDRRRDEVLNLQRTIVKMQDAIARQADAVNAAAMRAALENARSKFIHIKKCADEGEVSRKKLTILCEFVSQEIAAALAAPPRNCDRFATLGEAREAFQDLRGHKILADVELWDSMDEAGALVRWLFAPAEGGDHA